MNDMTYGIVPTETLLQYDGLTFMRGLIAGSFPAPPITQTLGFSLTEVDEGRALFTGEPEFRHYNPIGTVHGGFAMTLLDSALACAIHTTLAKGESYTTLEIKVNLVRALTRETGPVRAEGRIVHRGRNIGTSEGDLRDLNGKLYAHATTTCMIFPARG